MEAFAFLAPLAFVFSLAGISYATQAKKDIESLRKEVDALKKELGGRH